MADKIEEVGIRTGYVEGTGVPLCFAPGALDCTVAEMEILDNGKKMYLTISNSDGDTLASSFTVTEESTIDDWLHPEDEEKFNKCCSLEQNSIEFFNTISEAYANSKYDKKLWKKILKEFAKELAKAYGSDAREVEKDFETFEG